MNKVSVWTLASHLKKFSKPYSLLLWLAISLMAVDLLFSVGNSWVQQLLVDTMDDGRLRELMFLIQICLAVGMGCLAMLVIQFVMKNMYNSYVTRDFTIDFFEQCNQMSLLDLNQFASGDLVNRLNKDASSTSNILNTLIFDILFNVLLCAVVFIYLARIDFWLAIIALFGGPTAFLIGKLFDFRLRKVAVHAQQKEAEVRSFLQEIIQGIRTVKTLTLEKSALGKFNTLRKDHNRLLLKRTFLQTGMAQSIDLTFNAIAFTCAFFIAAASIRGELTPGQVLAFLFLTMRLMGPFLIMSQIWSTIQTSLGAADRVFQISNVWRRREEKRNHANERRTRKSSGSTNVALRIVDGSFSFDGKKSLFQDLNLAIKSGSSVAIVGPSGSGKSTLAKICAGLYPLENGYLEVFGQLSDENTDVIEKHITYVPQSPYLFSGTIRENIELGARSKVSDQELEKASVQAGIKEMVDGMKEGYDTRVGEKGSSLSGGQRQRIALARALIRDTPIIILDEVTSALDTESQKFIHHSLLELLHTGKTILIITHNMSLAEKADRVIVLENGIMTEDGTHDTLLQLNGKYARLYKTYQWDHYYESG